MARRGRYFSKARQVAERALSALYVGDWPARVWNRSPWAGRVSVRQLRWPHGGRPLRLGFASDLHFGPTTPLRLLEAAARALAAQRLDGLLLGGDYVFLEATPARAASLEAFVHAVGAPWTLAVWGNHDLWADHTVLESALVRAGVTVLVNDAVTRCGQWFVGLDDPWTGEANVARAFSQVPSDAPCIVLSHSPDGLPLIPARDAPTLVICGHTHGGHLATPWGPIVVPGRLGKQYPAETHELGSVTLHVSRGVGSTEVPFRTYAPPEVAVIETSTR